MVDLERETDIERLRQIALLQKSQLEHLIAIHAKKTENDKDALTRMAQAGAKSDKNYGVIVEPQGGLMLAKFVEVGTPVCQKEGQTDCNASELKGFQYRMDSGSGWNQGSSNRETSGGAMNNAGPMSKEAPSTQP